MPIGYPVSSPRREYSGISRFAKPARRPRPGAGQCFERAGLRESRPLRDRVVAISARGGVRSGLEVAHARNRQQGSWNSVGACPSSPGRRGCAQTPGISSRFRWCWVLLALVAWGGMAMGVHYHMGDALPISLDPWRLPQYALRTVLRMAAALVASLVFSLIYAALAAKSRQAEKILIPVLDVLQSVPILVSCRSP